MTNIHIDTNEDVITFIQKDADVFSTELDDYGRLIISSGEKLVAVFNSGQWNHFWTEDE